MVEKSIIEFRVICGSTATEFQDNLNATMENLAKENAKNVRYEFNHNAGHCCYISYEKMAAIPETLEEKYELRGEKWHCEDCPYYEKSTDKRVKYTHCQVGDKRAYAKCPACERFYEVLERGE